MPLPPIRKKQFLKALEGCVLIYWQNIFFLIKAWNHIKDAFVNSSYGVIGLIGYAPDLNDFVST
jgi:hypothetical protein